MSKFHEIPQIAQDLVETSIAYLRQQTIEPAKRLGKQAGMGIGGSMLLSIGAFLAILGVFALLRMVLPETEWYAVLARLLTAMTAAVGAALVAWRISK
jgi:hypothetical protein